MDISVCGGRYVGGIERAKKSSVLSARVHEMIHFHWYLQLWPANSA